MKNLALILSILVLSFAAFGDSVVVQSTRATYAVARLSANGGDALTTSAPTLATQGYALLPNYTALRLQFTDATNPRTITKWVFDSASSTWYPAGQIFSTSTETTFDQQVIVGSGRIYLQVSDAVGALSVNVLAEERL